MSDWYTLDADGNPVEAERDSDAMAFWKANKRVAADEIGGVRVSTVFLSLLSLNHAYGNNEPPLVFETMVFGGPLDGDCDRYSTRAQAIAGHAAMVKRVQDANSGMLG